MSTDREFTDRAPHDRPLNDKYSVIDETELDRDELGRNEVDSIEPDRDEPHRDELGGTRHDSTELEDAELDDTELGGNENPRDDDEQRVDDKAVINDEPADVAYEDVPGDGMSRNDVSPSEPSEVSFSDEAATKTPAQQAPVHLFEEHEAEQFRSQWREVQSGFVDEPRSAVREAESLVGKLMDELKAHIDEQKRSLEGDWDSDSKDTEELRVALRRYRSLFDQIVSI
jgi:hypothetical protein